jgi:hypothetical protein
MVMPIIRVTPQTYDNLAKLRMGFETADKTVARAVAWALAAQRAGLSADQVSEVEDEIYEEKASETESAFLPQGAYREPLLECMDELGGEAPVTKIRAAMERKLKSRLGDGDRALHASGAVRWWNFTQWSRQNLVQEGLFRPNSPRGVWALSEKGKRYVASKRR